MRKILLVAMVFTVAMTGLPAQAKTKTIRKYYEAPLALWERAGRGDPTCTNGRPPCTATQDGRFEFGGVVFDPIGGRYKTRDLTIRVRDDYNPWGKVSMSACEDTNGNGTCSSTTDRIWINTCLQPNQKLVLRRIRRDKRVIVTVQAAYSCTQYVDDIPDDQGGAISGWISLSYRV